MLRIVDFNKEINFRKMIHFASDISVWISFDLFEWILINFYGCMLIHLIYFGPRWCFFIYHGLYSHIDISNAPASWNQFFIIKVNHSEQFCLYKYFCRSLLLGEIVINLHTLYQLIINFHNFAANCMNFEYVTQNGWLSQ